MLDGVDPVLIFNFSKILPGVEEYFSDVPIVSQIKDKIGFVPIPVYLSETITGLYIVSEDKSLDIETSTETLADGSAPISNQKGLNSVIRINIVGHKNSPGLILLSAMMDLIFEKSTSKEYSMSYFHGTVAIFNGLLHAYHANQETNSELVNIDIEITKSTAKKTEAAKSGLPSVGRLVGAVPL